MSIENMIFEHKISVNFVDDNVYVGAGGVMVKAKNNAKDFKAAVSEVVDTLGRIKLMEAIL